MKVIFDSKDKSVVVVGKGEEFISAITKFAKERDVSFTFSMIGGASSVDIAFFDMNEKKYVTKTFSPGFSKNIEIVTVTGNVAWYEGEPMVHAHGIFSNEEYQSFNGHIMKITISITAETMINWLPTKIERQFEEETCLKLLK